MMVIEMEFGLTDEEDGEHKGVNLVEIYALQANSTRWNTGTWHLVFISFYLSFCPVTFFCDSS